MSRNFLFNLLNNGSINEVNNFIDEVNTSNDKALGTLSDEAVSSLFEIYKLDSTENKSYLHDVIDRTRDSVDHFNGNHKYELGIIEIMKSNRNNPHIYLGEKLFDFVVEADEISISAAREILLQLLKSKAEKFGEGRMKLYEVKDYLKTYPCLDKVIVSIYERWNKVGNVGNQQFFESIFDMIRQEETSQSMEKVTGEKVIFYIENYDKFSEIENKYDDGDIVYI